MAKVYPFFLAGEWQQSEEWLEVRSPHTGEVVGTTSVPTSEHLEGGVRGAVAAFETTRRLVGLARQSPPCWASLRGWDGRKMVTRDEVEDQWIEISEQ